MNIDTIRKRVHCNIGNRVSVVHHEGRNKTCCYEGRVIEVYQNLFIVLDHDSKRSVSYYDVLTNTVKISFKL